MNAAKLPNEIDKSKDDNSGTNKYTLLEENENEKFDIKINKTETGILIEANSIQNPNVFYKIELSLNDFYQLSKGFKMFDNLEEICDAIHNIFISQKVSIIKKVYNIVILFSINLIGGKEQEINIELNRFTLDKENNDINILKINELENEIIQIKNDKNILLKRINDLEDLVKDQNNELEKIKYIVKEQKNITEKLNNLEIAFNEEKYKIGKMNNLEKELKEQKREIEKIKNWKNEYNSELEEMQMIKINNISLNKIDSKIINRKEELEFLENRLKNDEILRKKNIIYKLLYRATEDGSNIKTFHNKCDNIKGTLTIIKTTKGMRFGGYTEQIWNGSKDGLQRKDGKDICFCFSLDLFKIYNFNNKCAFSIYCYCDRGPYFSGGDTFFYIYNSNGFLFGNNNYTKKGNSFGNVDNDYEINNGQSNFSVVELEVFQILFDN